MLINDFYKIYDLELSENTMKGMIQFNEQHTIFEGHFPGQPVVPGVCMMQMVKELLEKHFKKSLRLVSTGQVKFLQLITPDLSPEVNISWKEDASGYIVNAAFKLEHDLFKLSGTYQIGESTTVN